MAGKKNKFMFRYILLCVFRSTSPIVCHATLSTCLFDRSHLPCVAQGPSVSERINETRLIRRIRIRGASNIRRSPKSFKNISGVLHAVDRESSHNTHRGKAYTGLNVREYSVSAEMPR